MKKNEVPKYLDQDNNSANTFAMIILTLIGVLLLILAVALAYLGYVYSKLGQLEYEKPAFTQMPIVEETEEAIPVDAPTFVPPTATPIASPTPTLIPEMEEDIINILVLGCDTRVQGVYDGSRSDVNIIFTIDKINETVKITSLMRDILVYYDDLGDYQRLNYALRYYGDPQGAVKIVEENFDIEIDHYMITDFAGMAQIIDILGGVEVYGTAAEIENMNDILWNLNELYNYDDLRQDFYFGDSGDIILSGRQAVAYMRVRKVGADYERVERQYEVLNCLKGKLSSMGFLEINKIIGELPNLLATDMDQMEMVNIAGTLYKMRDCDMQQARVPFEGYYKSSTYKKMWILDIDFAENKRLLREFIYSEDIG